MPEFVEAPAPTDEALQTVLHKIITRTMKLLTRRGVLVEAEGSTNERVQTNAAGQVMLKLKTAWRDGTTHLVISPLEFMQRLAALVPRPRLGHGEGKRGKNPILAWRLLRARKKRYMIIRRPKRQYFFDHCHGETSREQFRTA